MNYCPLAAESSVPPSPRHRSLQSGLSRELLAREQFPFPCSAGFFLSILYQAPFSSQTFGEGAAAMVLLVGSCPSQPRAGAAVGFLPSNPLKFPPGERAEDVPAAQPGGISTTPLLWAPLHRLPKMGIKEPRRGIYFLPKTILKITNTSKLVTCGASVRITRTFCLGEREETPNNSLICVSFLLLPHLLLLTTVYKSVLPAPSQSPLL